MKVTFRNGCKDEYIDHLKRVFHQMEISRSRAFNSSLQLNILAHISVNKYFEVRDNEKSNTGLELVLPDYIKIPGIPPIEPDLLEIRVSSVERECMIRLQCVLD